MKVYNVNHKENTETLMSLIINCIQTESDYETLKCKTNDAELLQLVEAKQESTTDFILSALRLLQELNPSKHNEVSIVNDFHFNSHTTKFLIVNLDSKIILRECKKIDTAHLHALNEEMTKHEKDSVIYELLAKRLEKLYEVNSFEENSPLLVG